MGKLTLVAAFLFLLPAGCVEYALHSPCDTNKDCEADQFCYAGLCHDKLPCDTDDDCDAGQVCTDGLCLPPGCVKDSDCPETQRCIDDTCIQCSCVTDDDCPQGTVCKDSCICTEPEVTPCASDMDCPIDQWCVDSECVDRQSCNTDDDCPGSMVCNNNFCFDGCASDSDCPPLTKCLDGRCRQNCFTDANCLVQGQICENGTCVDAQCVNDSDCEGENVRCTNGRCEAYTPCEHDPDCNDPEWTCIDGICEELPLCAIDAQCAQDEICLNGHCHTAQGCANENDCDEQHDCVGGLCVPHVCRGADDCPPDMVCTGGQCVEKGNPAMVYEVVILTPGGPIAQGQSIHLHALALTQSGNSVPGISFDWVSSDPTHADVDSAGLLTGGNEAGDTKIRATAHGTDRTSRPVTFTNMLSVPLDSMRITAVSAMNRKPTQDALVLVQTGTELLQDSTDQDGTVTFPVQECPVDIHVFSQGHDAVSVVGTCSVDILIPLPPKSTTMKAGGFVGQMEFQDTAPVSLGLAGLSVGGDILDLSFASLMGSVFRVPVQFGTYSFDLPLPAQLVLGLSFQGIPIEIKPGYNVLGKAGLRSAWAFGGNLDMAAMGALTGGSSIGDVIANLLPYFAMLDHGIRPVQDVRAIPMVQDEDDVDRDGDTQEMRPDWDSFPDVDLAPSQAQTMALQVSSPTAPLRDGQAVGTALVVAGAMGETGFTPLGLTSISANGQDFPDLRMKMAPAHGGLEVWNYAVALMAIPGTNSNGVTSELSAVLHVSQNMPSDVSFEQGFLGFAEDAVFHRPTRTLLASGVSGAEIMRLRLDGPGGGWTVWLASADLVELNLPATPDGFDDPVPDAKITLDAIRLKQGMGFEDLVSFDGQDLDNLSELTTAYSKTELN